MSAGQLNVNPETGDEETQNVTTPTPMHNLRPQPTKVMTSKL